MTPERIKELRTLCEVATPGPWEVNRIHGYTTNQIETRHPDHQGTPWGHVVTILDLADGDKTQTKFERDSDFIAVSRTVLPDALDEIERLRNRPHGAIWQDLIAEIGRLQAELTRRDAILEQDITK